jgi:hypothetical protein
MGVVSFLYFVAGGGVTASLSVRCSRFIPFLPLVCFVSVASRRPHTVWVSLHKSTLRDLVPSPAMVLRYPGGSFLRPASFCFSLGFPDMCAAVLVCSVGRHSHSVLSLSLGPQSLFPSTLSLSVLARLGFRAWFFSGALRMLSPFCLGSLPLGSRLSLFWFVSQRLFASCVARGFFFFFFFAVFCVPPLVGSSFVQPTASPLFTFLCSWFSVLRASVISPLCI